METLFEADQIYRNGLYDGGVMKAQQLLRRIEREAPKATRAQHIIRSDIVHAELQGGTHPVQGNGTIRTALVEGAAFLVFIIGICAAVVLVGALVGAL